MTALKVLCLLKKCHNWPALCEVLTCLLKGAALIWFQWVRVWCWWEDPVYLEEWHSACILETEKCHLRQWEGTSSESAAKLLKFLYSSSPKRDSSCQDFSFNWRAKWSLKVLDFLYSYFSVLEEGKYCYAFIRYTSPYNRKGSKRVVILLNVYVDVISRYFMDMPMKYLEKNRRNCFFFQKG